MTYCNEISGSALGSVDLPFILEEITTYNASHNNEFCVSLEPEDDGRGFGRLLSGEEPEEQVRVALLSVDSEEAGVALHGRQ